MFCGKSVGPPILGRWNCPLPVDARDFIPPGERLVSADTVEKVNQQNFRGILSLDGDILRNNIPLSPPFLKNDCVNLALILSVATFSTVSAHKGHSMPEPLLTATDGPGAHAELFFSRRAGAGNPPPRSSASVVSLK